MKTPLSQTMMHIFNIVTQLNPFQLLVPIEKRGDGRNRGKEAGYECSDSASDFGVAGLTMDLFTMQKHIVKQVTHCTTTHATLKPAKSAKR